MQQRVRAEAAQRDSESRLRLLADNLPALISYLDADLKTRFANSCYREWFGIDPAAMIGKRHDELFGEVAYREVLPYLEGALAGMPATYEREVSTLSGPRYTRTVVLPHLDGEGRVLGIHRMTTDISADRKRELELDRLACQDGLTGLPNRRAFEDALPRAIARGGRSDGWLALLFVDLDRFKSVNDTLGHAAGDDVLKVTAARVAANVRATDTVARLGGDEFIVILEGLRSADEATRLAAKIIEAVRQPIETSAGTCAVGASIGIAACARGCVDAAELVRRADAAGYVAKNAGRGRWHMAQPDPAPLRLVQSG